MRAARTCFANAGFQATTVDHIATEAEVSVGLLYRVFGSKMAIVEAIILEQVEVQSEQAFRIITSSFQFGIDREMVLSSLITEELDLQTYALMFETAAEACRNSHLRHFISDRRAELHVKLITRLKDAGFQQERAERMFIELEAIGAVLSGAIIQSITRSGSMVAEAVETTFRAIGSHPSP
ncbi:TetR/AcrR family transcriptional regulator [uncultured Sphingomonas sp.]|uniref:TetR/AcrR family transcriptional regulator n=1 Tax=uncultured Sphingomonas sp. TaxID=158754 RepID=UPI0035CC2F0A